MLHHQYLQTQYSTGTILTSPDPQYLQPDPDLSTLKMLSFSKYCTVCLFYANLRLCKYGMSVRYVTGYSHMRSLFELLPNFCSVKLTLVVTLKNCSLSLKFLAAGQQTYLVAGLLRPQQCQYSHATGDLRREKNKLKILHLKFRKIEFTDHNRLF